MIKLELTFPTLDEAHEALGKLNGIAVESASTEEVKPKKKATPKQKADAETENAFEEDEAPAKASTKSKAKTKTKAKGKAPSVDELKSHILECAGDDPEANANIKEFVRSFGATKISDLTVAQRKEAMDSAADYFSPADDDDAGEDEEDPMA